MLRIRDMLVRIRILIPDPYLWLMDPDPTPDPNTFFRDFKDLIKKTFSHIFFLTYSQVWYIIFSLKN